MPHVLINMSGQSPGLAAWSLGASLFDAHREWPTEARTLRPASPLSRCNVTVVKDGQ